MHMPKGWWQNSGLTWVFYRVYHYNGDDKEVLLNCSANIFHSRRETRRLQSPSLLLLIYPDCWKKFRTSTGFEPVTSRLPVRCSTNWAMKPLTLGAGQLWAHMFPWKASLPNCINCVHCDDHFFIFISFPQFIYDLFHISLTIISFTGTYETTIGHSYLRIF